MRVLLVSDAYYPYPSGVSELTHNRMLYLKEKGIEVDILTSSYGKDDEKYDVYRLGKVIKIPANGSYITMTYDRNMANLVRDFFKEHKYDIIHLAGPFPPDLSYFVMKYGPKDVPMIGEFQAASDIVLKDYYKEGNVFEYILAFFMKAGGTVFNSIFKKDFSRLDRMIAISKDAKIFFNTYIKGEYKILPCGVDTNRFNPKGSRFAGIDENIPSILFMGRLDKRKGLDRLLKVMPIILKEMPNIKLYVGGKGPMYKYYKKMVKSMNLEKNVEFLGYIKKEDLPSLYRSVSLYVSPATGGETFGIVLIEAMASGIPVIASDIPGYRCVIDHNVNGILVDTTNSQLFSLNILNILRSREKARDLSKKALEKIYNKYDWNVIIDETIEIYKDLISSK